MSVVPISDIGGEISPQPIATYADDFFPGTGPADYIKYHGPMVAGLTTKVIFYFKRQKQSPSTLPTLAAE